MPIYIILQHYFKAKIISDTKGKKLYVPGNKCYALRYVWHLVFGWGWNISLNFFKTKYWVDKKVMRNFF
jgi:hypothetical protein